MNYDTIPPSSISTPHVPYAPSYESYTADEKPHTTVGSYHEKPYNATYSSLLTPYLPLMLCDIPLLIPPTLIGELCNILDEHYTSLYVQ